MLQQKVKINIKGDIYIETAIIVVIPPFMFSFGLINTCVHVLKK